MKWIAKHPGFHSSMLGYIPSFLDEADPRGAKAQFDKNYVAGWRPFEGFTMLENGNLSYPGDPETQLLAECKFRDETIRFYQHAWVVVIARTGTWEVCRMD